MRGHRRLFSKSNHHMAQQRQHSGKRFSQNGRQFLCISRRAQITLPQLQQDRAQVMLNLHTMQVHRYFNVRNDVRSVKDSPPALHIQNLDGEDIRGISQLILREEKRRRLFLLDAPPFHHVCEAPQLLDTQRTKDANHVEVRVSFVKVTARSRPEQNDAFEVCRREFLQPVDQLRQFCFCGEHSYPFLSPRATSLLKRLRLRCCRRQIPQIRRHHRLRRSLPRPSLPSRLPNAFQRCPRASPVETRASRFRPIRLRGGPRREKPGWRSPKRARSNRARTKVADSRRDSRCFESVPREADRLALHPHRLRCTWLTATRRPRLPCRSPPGAKRTPSRDRHLPRAHR